jgi:hypothetical protein
LAPALVVKFATRGLQYTIIHPSFIMRGNAY